MRSLLLAVLVIFAASPTSAQTLTAIEVDTSKPGTYVVTVDAAGDVTFRPLRLIRLGNQPQPPDEPGNPNTPFENEVNRLASEALNSGGTKTTAVAIATVYSLVSENVASGSIALDKWPQAVKAATDAVLGVQSDGAKWATFRTSVGGALTTLQAQGALDSKEEVSAALESVAVGLRKASGTSTWKLKHVTGLKKSDIPAWDVATGSKQDGLLDGVDLAQIIELVKLIMELLKLFGAGK